ncbi:Cysteine-rich receptor-like protein kinase 28 [Linum perenne]
MDGVAWRNWKAGMYSNIVDPSLENVPENEIARCIHIALLCVQETINDRPTMTSVALMLTNNLANLQLPSMPAFFVQTSTAESREHSSSLGYSSTSTTKKTITSSSSAEVVPPSRNDVSITELYPR